MIFKLEYDRRMRWLNLATVAVFALALFVPAARAQVNSGPSVTSPGFGGSTAPRGMPPSVTSVGFGGHDNGNGNDARGIQPSVTSPGFGKTNPGFSTHPVSHPGHHPQPDHHPHHHDNPSNSWASAVYAVPYYAYPYDNSSGATDDSQAADSPDDEYQGGPTIFDRRGPGTRQFTEDSYSDERSMSSAAAVKAEVARVDDQPLSNQPDTVLIFKDGHQLEVSNYAIVGSILFDLSEGHHHKIPLTELNLTATAKENDDRGTDFQLPVGLVEN